MKIGGGGFFSIPPVKGFEYETFILKNRRSNIETPMFYVKNMFK